MQIVPRPYQQLAVDAALREFDRGIGSTLIEMPTGTGKTVVFAFIGHSRAWGKVLVLAPRREIIYQAVDKIEAVTGDRPDIEMADLYAPTMQLDLFAASKYVVGSIQTVSKQRRLKRFDWKEFGLVVIDEGHHATAASYRKVIDFIRAANPAVKFLLVTATPDRADGVKLGTVVESVAYQYPISEATDDGYLVPIRQYFASVEGLDFSGVHTRGGDLDEGELSAMLRDDGGQMAHRVAAAMVKAAGDKRSLIFTVDVAHARNVADIIGRMPGKSAVAVDGTWETEKREAVLRSYRANEFQFLVNCQLFLEGWDEPTVEVVGMARPTKSRALYAQAVGRGLRPLAGLVDGESGRTSEDRRRAISSSNKPHCLVVDLAGNSGRHKLVCTADILGSGYDPAVVEAATKRARKRKTPADMKQLLDEEKAKIELRKHESDLKREARKAGLYGNVRMTMVEIDPFNPDVVPAMRDGDFDTQPRAASSSQVEFLEKIGIPAMGLSWDEAQTLIGEHHSRKKKGLCSIKQKQLLERHGIDASDMSREMASVNIEFMRAIGWQKPPGVTKEMLHIRPKGDGTFRVVAHLPDGHKIGIGPGHATVDAARQYGQNLVTREADHA